MHFQKALNSFPFYITAEMKCLKCFLSKKVAGTSEWRMPKLFYGLISVKTSEYSICFKRYYFKIWDIVFTVDIFINTHYCWGQRKCFQTQNHVFKHGYILENPEGKKIFCLKSHTKQDSSSCKLSESWQHVFLRHYLLFGHCCSSCCNNK